MAENEQTVEPEQQQATENQAASGESELDTLLQEYQESSESTSGPKSSDQPKPRPDPKLRRDLQEVVSYVQEERQTKVDEALKADVEAAVEFIGEVEELKDFPVRLRSGFLHDLAANNLDFSEAFKQRKESPDAWSKALVAARDEMIEEVKNLPGNEVRSDVEAAKAAVSGSSNEAPPPPEGPTPQKKMAMSDTAWENYKTERRAEARAAE